MSILLEALRKSEKSQRPVAPPTIHADDPGSLATESMRALPVALLIFAALLVTAWLVWRQYQPVTDVYQPPVTLPASKTASNPASNPLGEPAQKPAEIQTPVTEETTDSSKSVAKKAAGGSSDGKRTPVESYTPAASAEDVSDGTEERGGQTVKKTPDAVAKTPRPQSQAGQKGGGKKGGKSVATTKPGGKAEATQPYQSPEPEPISYWELPDAVRDEVPEIKFSVLVYADTPADRFVLMNGQRLGEGDSYQEGLVVKEIRRDGVVFSYRLYQFLVRR